MCVCVCLCMCLCVCVCQSGRRSRFQEPSGRKLDILLFQAFDGIDMSHEVMSVKTNNTYPGGKTNSLLVMVIPRPMLPGEPRKRTKGEMLKAQCRLAGAPRGFPDSDWPTHFFSRLTHWPRTDCCFMGKCQALWANGGQNQWYQWLDWFGF